MIVSREERLFDFDIVNPLSKSNAGRGRRPNFVFLVGWECFICQSVGGDGMEQILVQGQLRFHLMCSGGCKMSSGFDLFAADANEGNRDVGQTQNQGCERVWNSMWIASANSRSVRGASHQPAFMDSSLTIGHMYWPCLPGGRCAQAFVFYDPL